MNKTVEELIDFSTETVTVFSIKGIPCKISNAWFIYFFALTIFLLMTREASAATLMLLGTLIAYLSVIAHEYGHAIVSQFFGGSDLEVTIYPYSGLASGNIEIRERHGLFWIAAAGPIVNAAIALIGWFLISNIGESFHYFLTVLISINAAMAFFNILPIYPLDGGRILKMFFQKRFGDINGFQLASWAGLATYSLVTVVAIEADYVLFPVIGLLMVCLGFMEFQEEKELAVKREHERMKRFFLSPIEYAHEKLNPEDFDKFTESYFNTLESLEGDPYKASRFRNNVLRFGYDLEAIQKAVDDLR